MSKESSQEAPVGLSFVIPLYRSADCAERLIEELSKVKLDCPHEIVLVNDGSPDDTRQAVEKAMKKFPGPYRYYEHNRNYGEHNAVMSGYRLSRGEYVVNLDDDLQNPVDEAVRLYEHARENNFDAVYSYYEVKHHAAWRNLGSRFTNFIANQLIDKPGDLYLSSFRVVRGRVARTLATYQGPYPYIDGLLFQYTQNVGRLKVRHEDRFAGESNYNLRRLISLWLNMATSFSVLPLRLSMVIGMLVSACSFIGGIVVLLEYFFWGIAVEGYASLILGLLFFSGVQLLMLGVVGEYLGRVFLTLNGKPQSFLRTDIDERAEAVKPTAS